MSGASRIKAPLFWFAVTVGIGSLAMLLLGGDSTSALEGDITNVVAPATVEEFEAAASEVRGAPVSLEFDESVCSESDGDVVSARDRATQDVYWFRPDSGEVIFFQSEAGRTKSAGPRKSHPELESLARAAAERLSPALFAGEVKQCAYAATVCEDEEVLAVEFRSYSDGGVRTGFARVKLNAVTGAIRAFNTDGTRTSVSLEPKVPKDDALSVAAQVLGMPIHVVEETELAVFRPVDAAQRLVWNIRLRTGDEHLGAIGVATIDAHTGEVVESGVSE
jgi:hypothetical protein